MEANLRRDLELMASGRSPVGDGLQALAKAVLEQVGQGVMPTLDQIVEKVRQMHKPEAKEHAGEIAIGDDATLKEDC